MAAKPKNVVYVKPKKDKRVRIIIAVIILALVLWGFFH